MRPAREALRLPILSKDSKAPRLHNILEGKEQRHFSMAGSGLWQRQQIKEPSKKIRNSDVLDRSEYEVGFGQTTFSLAAGNRHSCQTSIAPLVATSRDLAIRNSTCKHFGRSEYQKKERPSIPSTAGIANFWRVSLTSLDQSFGIPAMYNGAQGHRPPVIVTGNHPPLRGEFGNRHPRPKDIQNEIY